MPWGWKMRKFGYATEDVDYEKLKSDAKELLSKVNKGNEWKCGCGTTHIPLTIDNEIVGELWEDVDLSSLEIGSYWSSRRGTKVQLVSNGKVVGFVWME